MDARESTTQQDDGQQAGPPELFDDADGREGPADAALLSPPSRPVLTSQDAAPPSLPRHLQELLQLPGVPDDLFAGVAPGRAWAKLTQLGAEWAGPLAHLAPDALAVLAEHGFSGHVKGELADGPGAKPSRYFAFRLPEAAQPEQAVDPNAPLLRRLDRLEDGLAQLAAATAQLAKAPRAGLDLGNLQEVLALLPQLKRGAAHVRELLGALEAPAPAADPEDQAAVLGALFGGVRNLLDSELAQDLLALLTKKPRGNVRVMPGGQADAG